MATASSTDRAPTIGPFRINTDYEAHVIRRSLPRPLVSGEPLAIVWHCIGAGAARFNGQQIADRLSRGILGSTSWHYTIDKDGSIYQHVPTDMQANHCATDTQPYLNERGDWRTETPTHNLRKAPSYQWWQDAHPGMASPVEAYPKLFQFGVGSINKCTLGVEFMATSGEELTTPQLIAAEFLAKVVHPDLDHCSHSDLQPHRRNRWDLSPEQWAQLNKHLSPLF